MRFAFARLSYALVVLCAITCARRAHAEADTFGLGNGSAGSITYSGGAINVLTTLSGAANAASTTINVLSATGIGANDLVLLWQSTGSASPTSGVQTAIALAGTGIGAWEFARVASVNNNALTLTNPTVASFPASFTQVIRVPEYQDFTIGAQLTAPAYNAANGTGGIVVFLAKGTVTNNAGIVADATGFSGGTNTTHARQTGCTALDGAVTGTNTGGAKKGGAIESNTQTNGRGNVANGGGGGDCDRAGGGGGGNAAQGGDGGKTNDGGGRAVGGLGGAALTYSAPSALIMGGGGGAGDATGGSASGGASGGGVIFLRASALAGNAAISAKGANGGTPGNQGAGGGGAGGTIVARFAGAATCVLALNANGGNGGSPTGPTYGPGGGGAGGTVFIQGASVASNCAPVVSGGSNGTNGSTTAYGSTAGGAGQSQTSTGGGFCATTGECGGSLVCDAAISTCVQCTANSDCASTVITPACDGTTHRCRGCQADNECGGSTPGCVLSGPKQGQCVECTSDGNCGPSAPRCDTTLNVCRACLTSSDCTSVATKPVCDVSSKTCRACVFNSECANGTFCNTVGGPTLGACVACASDNDCSGTPSTPRCNTSTNQCVACLTRSDCGGTKPVCTNNACAACSGDPDCGGSTPACQPSGACGQCSANNASRCTGGTHVCDVPSGTCIGCRSSADCAGSSPICNTSTNVCHACAVTADCTGVAGGPACVTSGAKQGQCVGCVDGTTCNADAGTGHCDTISNACVACLIDSDCTGANEVCNPTNHTCTAGCANDQACPVNQICDKSQVATGVCSDGCRNVLGTTHCETGKYCSKRDGSIGACTPEPCMVNGDCASGTVCDTNIEPHACVECATTADCTNNRICSQSTHTCVSLSGDGGLDGGDATVPDSGSTFDSGGSIDATASEAGSDFAPDGTLDGGGCNATGTAGGALDAILGAILAGAMTMRRRRRR